jgi:hypothetical protein
MTLELNQFVELVSKMRIAQKIYFGKRSTDALIDAKQYETQVDAAITALYKFRREAAGDEKT